MRLAQAAPEGFVRQAGFVARAPVRVDAVPSVAAKLMRAERAAAWTLLGNPVLTAEAGGLTHEGIRVPLRKSVGVEGAA